MEDVLIPLIVVPILFIGLPWLIFHYVTKWKQAATLTAVGRETARRAARRRPPARRPAVLDRADHDRRESRTGASNACPAASRSACLRTESDDGRATATIAANDGEQGGQPPSRTRFYRDKRNGKVMGVCAGIADYTGFDVNLVRVCMVAAVFMSSGSILPFYFIAGCMTPDKPRALAVADREETPVLAGRPRVAGPHARATSARASRTSIAGSPTSKAM